MSFAHPTQALYQLIEVFFGSKPFSKANAILRKSGLTEIEWGAL